MISNLAQGVQAFTSNAFLVSGVRTTLVDTGANFDIVTRLEERVGDQGLDAIVLTHTHPDHVGNLETVKAAFDVEAWGYDETAPGVDHALADEDSVMIGDDEYLVLHTPGHKDDHLCLYAAEPGICFGGDLVFQNGSFGRTDLPEGNRATLIESIDRLLTVVGDDLQELHTGHGPSVTNEPYGHIELASQMARR